MDYPTRTTALIETIYEAAAEPERWPAALQSLSDCLSAGMSGLVVQDLRTGGFPVAAADPRSPEQGLREYVEYYGARDPLREVGFRRAGEILTDRELVTGTIRRSETYRDFYERWGLDHFISYGWGREEGQAASLVVYRGPSQGNFTADEEALMQQIVPHLRRAVRITTSLRRADAEVTSLRAALDRFTAAIFLLDRNATLVECNRAAQEMLARGDAFVVHAGILKPRNASASAHLASAIRASAMCHATAPVELTTAAGDRLTAVAAPHGAGGTGGVMLIVTVPRQERTAATSVIASLYGFTATEADIASRLVGGMSLKEIADERNVSLHTVRTQMKQVLRKANARSQADLVRMVATSPAHLIRSARE